MGYRILALLDDNVAIRLLLTSRLFGIGHRLVVVSQVEDVERRLGIEAFDWLVLDGAVARRAGERLRAILSEVGAGLRIAWIGDPAPPRDIVITSHFSKPPVYDLIAETFERSLREDDPGRTPGSAERRSVPS